MEISELEEYPFEAPEGLPVGWIEVTDPEDSEEIRKKTRVLVRQIRGFEFIYATVIEVVKIGFYKICTALVGMRNPGAGACTVSHDLIISYWG